MEYLAVDLLSMEKSRRILEALCSRETEHDLGIRVSAIGKQTK